MKVDSGRVSKGVKRRFRKDSVMLRNPQVHWASFLLAAACSAEAPSVGETSTVEQSLSSGDVMGFEALGAWTASSGTLSRQITRTQGAYSLGVANIGYTELTSAPLANPSRMTPVIGFDLMLPAQPPNPYWLGNVQLFVDSPTLNIHNLMLGQKELTGSPLNRFFTVQMTMTSLVASQLQMGRYSDLRFRIVLNVPQSSALYRLDNLRFLPDIKAGRPRHTDVFILKDISTCVIGDPCPDGTGQGCLGMWSAGDQWGDGVADNENVRIVKPSDPARYTAPHAFCFHDMLDATEVSALRTQLTTFRNNIYNWSSGDINLALDIHEIGTVEMTMSNWYGFWAGPWDTYSVAQPYLTRDTDFVLVFQSVYDPHTGWHHGVGGCGGSFGANLGYGGVGYSAIPVTTKGWSYECENSGVIAHEWMHQLDWGLHNLSGYTDIYYQDGEVRNPPCGQAAADPYQWFPGSDQFCGDPDLPLCGQDPCGPEPNNPNNVAVSHMLQIHWKYGQTLVTNHCQDGAQDFDETGIDTGAECL